MQQQRAFSLLIGLVLVGSYGTLASPAIAERVPKCLFGPGALPGQTQPHKPHGDQIPIDTSWS